MAREFGLDKETAEEAADARSARILEDLKGLAAGRPQDLPPELVQAMLAVACRAYSAHAEDGLDYPVFGREAPANATDVMHVAGAMLKAVDLGVFDLGMWQSWRGR